MGRTPYVSSQGGFFDALGHTPARGSGKARMNIQRKTVEKAKMVVGWKAGGEGADGVRDDKKEPAISNTYTNKQTHKPQRPATARAQALHDFYGK